MAKRRPSAPTKQDVDEHLPLHLEYRDWFEECVAGRGHAAAHRRKPEDEESLGITVRADCRFYRKDEREGIVLRIDHVR